MFGACYEVGAHFTPQRKNVAWWSCWIICTMVEEVTGKGEENERVRYWKQKIDGVDRWIKTTLLELSCPPDRFLGQYLYHPLLAFTEVRQFWSRLPAGLINTYHSFTVIDAAGDFSLLLEKKTNQLEFMFGRGPLARTFMKEFRALATPRNVNRCTEQPRRPLPGDITVCRLLDWMDEPLAKRWLPYSLWDSNCQHFSKTVEDFLCDPGSLEWQTVHPLHFQGWRAQVQAEPERLQNAPEELQSSRSFILEVVSVNGKALRFVPRNFKMDWRVVCSAIAQDGLALEYVGDDLRRDPEVALLAVRQNGLALQFCAKCLQQDKHIVLAAVQQTSAALQFSGGAVPRDADVLMAVGRQDPLALRFAVA
mmetsp:Transcript_61267/g.163931  ORF Transcript_61267/g.163931 Transcript_61267/m.163931 type:complete len:365 (-) Transcript_61267:13-1107(-)